MKKTLRQFKALADPTRLRIMLLLLSEELCVCELETILSMEQSRISHALRVLKQAGLVDESREGRWMFYRASKELAKNLADYLGDSAQTQEIEADRERMQSLLSSPKPSGRRCPLRDKK